ncbi:DUF4011 domain-containing protein [Patulibacter sp. SYSU D01012]|uniref:DUF4011 domain-containing protein n=1 Tax=Patulibacter sp. SYSU D01012 TaxID=2817381 RepID=UPI001B3181A1|nr:DUF4011 domain-containing protein [Patulibacter sp. SYSU D01012]
MDHEPLWARHHVVRDGLEVEVFTQPAVNLALVHNRVPLVQSVQVRNAGEVPQVDVTVTVSLHGQGADLSEPWTRTFDGELAPGREVSWSDLPTVHPAHEHLAGLNESHPATLRVVASRTWGDDAELAIPIDVLAANEWFNAPIFFSSLAAFVQPNTRAVGTILDAAAELLRKETGDSSLGGYQKGPERAAQIAAAIYAALHARRIRYIDPPASFEDTGQKVRTTAQVLEERFGTCVDLAVTYAACLEQAGLFPVLWLVDGHAFAGFVRDGEGGGLPQAVLTEPNQLVNFVESGVVVPVEAAFYGDEKEHGFAGAVAIAKSRFSDPDALRGLIAVTSARHNGIRPLPSRDEMVVLEPEDEPITAATGNALDLPPELRAAHAGDNVLLDVTDDAPPRVVKWKRSLLDLSTRNRLLNLRPSAQVLDLHVPSGALPLLDDLVHQGRTLRLRPQDALSDVHQLQGARRAQDVDTEVITRLLREDHTVHVAVTQAKYRNSLRVLARTARTMFEETGNSNLYLTFGALVHTTPSGKEARAPLFLIPARVEGGTGRSEFRVAVDPTNVATPNHCLVEWLRLKHGVRIADLEQPRLDDSGIDVAHALPAIRAALLEHALDFRIDEVASLAICQFSTFGMWQDLERSWDVLQQSPIVQHLALHAQESFQDPAGDGVDIAQQEVDETDVAVPIPADGSQLRAIALAAAGRTFVLEGPPGTGKSQTITNLIAHALDRGKTVLFVAEKQAALDVVKRRLAKVGLEDFTLDLHGKDQQPALIRQQLKRAIDNGATYERRGWDAKLATFRGRHAPLAEYPEKVHAKNGLGYSLWSAAAGLRQFGDGPSAPVPASFVLNPTVESDELLGALQNFARASRAVRLAPDHPWALVGRVDGDLDAASARAAIAALTAAFDGLAGDDDAQRLAKLAGSPRELSALLPQIRERLEHEGFGADELHRVRGVAWRSARGGLEDEVVRFGEQHAAVLQRFTPTFLEDGDLTGLSGLAEEAQKGLFGKKKKAERFEQAVGGLLLPGQTLEAEQVDGIVLAVTAARDHAARLSADARDLLQAATPAHWTPLRPDTLMRLTSALDAIDRAVAFADAHPDLWRRLEEHGAASEASVRTLEAVAAAVDRWLALLGTDDADLDRWTRDRPWTEAWRADLVHWSAEVADGGDVPIRRWAQMVAFLDPLRAAGLDAFREALLTASLPAEEAEVAFLRGSAAASVRERRAVGGLDVFDAALRDGEIEDFASAASALREEQTVALPAALIERRPYRAGSLAGPVGELRRKLDAKRKGATFRQLIEQYGEEILQATPCFFVSPTSLAQFVPPGSVTFDLVVFDEASQVTVPQAIGALGRGRSAVVVGDSQQMPPTSVGKVSMTGAGEDDEADAPPEDLESILTECVESQVPRLWLSWHYRSQDEALIAFSNQHYYEGNLASLPSPGGDPTAGVELRRVDGQFDRGDAGGDLRTNRVEAEAIVDEIRRRVADPALAGQSIGVVTFNAQQQTLVQNLLEDSGDPLVAAQLRPDATEGIFVKNLENVQGDERDVILFSTAFSKRPEGGPLPMNFGPITAQGGEKRLNVAVTRARRKVVLFTSFDPSDIDLSRTSSRGMAHLRGYLEMAANGAAAMAAPQRSVVGHDVIGGAIAEALRGRGYEVEANYGLSDFSLDLVVREAGAERWQAAIVLDGPGWAKRPTVADRDLTPGLLEPLMGWGASLRVWLPEWLDAPDAVLDRVDAAINAAKERAEAERVRLAEAAAEQERRMEEARRRAEEEAAAGDDGEEFDEEPVEVETYVPANDLGDVSGARAGGDPSDLDEALVEAFRNAGERERVAREREASTSANDAVYASSLTALPGGSIEVGSDGGEEPAAEPPDASGGEEQSPLAALGPVVRDWTARGEDYVEEPATPLGVREDLDRTNSRSIRATITAAARRTVEQEGPMTTERLARSVGRRFGFSSVAAARRRFILDLVPSELIHRSELGDFVWPSQIDPATWRGYRATPADMVRPLADIAPEEIVNAMAAVCARSPITSDEQLFRETLAVFGQKRLTGTSQARLARCRDLGLAVSRLVTDGERWRAGA